MIKLNGMVTYKLDANTQTTLDFVVEEGTPADAAEAVKTLMVELRKGLPEQEETAAMRLDEILNVLENHESAHLGLDNTLLTIKRIAEGKEE